MTDKEMAIAIARRVLQFQAREIAADMYIGRLRLDGKPLPFLKQLEEDTDNYMAPEAAFGKWLSQIEQALEDSSPSEVLGILHRELFDPSPLKQRTE